MNGLQIRQSYERGPQTARLNCWEFKQCGRELGGKNAAAEGVCLAAAAQHADSIHGGKNGGRCCWVTARTLFTNVAQFDTCRRCDFYESVRREEQTDFKVVLVIQNEIRARLAVKHPPAPNAALTDF
jgi:hypothetical protein